MALQSYGGPGMVAVVRGLPDSNLAVTLLDGKRTYTLQPDGTPTCKTLELKENFVQNRHPPTSDASAQANDDTYVSSYQVSHCKVRPTSPPLELTEFPPQKSTPSLGHGNFKIEGLRNKEHTKKITSNGNSRSRPIKNYKRFTNSARACRENDLFANSLRKYPNYSISPERSDIIEKIINITQSKFTTKEGKQLKHQAKAKNNNFAKVIEDLKNTRFNTTSKNLQTYTRINKISNDAQESPTKDLTEKNTTDTKLGKEANKNISDINYDYFANEKVNKADDNIDFPINGYTYSKCMDVRYLCDVTKCIRERIKQIVEDSNNNCGNNNICPRHKERLLQHRKEHHGSGSVSPECCTSEKEDDHGINHKEATTSCQSDLKVSTAVSCSPSCFSYNKQSKELSIIKSYSTEIKQKGLAVGNKSSYNSDISQREYPEDVDAVEHSNSMTSIYRTNQTIKYKPNNVSSRSKSEEILNQSKQRNNDFHEKFHSWLQEVPVFQNESEENKILRNNMIEDLENRLMLLCNELDSKELENQIRTEAEKTLQTLPIWHPQDKEDEEVFINKIVSNLIKLIRMNNKETYGSYINTPIIIERSECKHGLCYDKFRSIIFEWVNNLPLKKNRCGNFINKKEIVDCINNRLRPLAMKRPKCKSIYKYILRDHIKSVLKELPLSSFCCTEEEALNDIALKLAGPLSRVKLKNEIIIPTSCCQSKGSMKPETSCPVPKDLQELIVHEISDVLGHSQLEISEDERNKTAFDISNYLLKSSEVVRGVKVAETNFEISRFLQNILNLNSTQATDIANIIIDRIQESSLLNATRFSKTPKITKQRTIDATNTQFINSNVDSKSILEQSIKSWIEDISLKLVDSEKKVKELTENLAHVETHNDINESRRNNEVKRQVRAWIKNIQLEQPLHIPLNEHLLPQIEEQILHWLYELPIETPINFQELKIDIIDLVKKHECSFNEMKIEIENILANMSMSPNFERRKPEIADKLIRQIKYIVTKCDGSNSFIDNVYLKSLENKIRLWSEKLPFEIKSSQIDDMIKELARDVLDCLQYLESNPNKTFSEDDQNNYLEYQVFKWLHKLTNKKSTNNFQNNSYFPYIEDLIHAIKTIPKPNTQESFGNTIAPDPVTRIKHEMNKWFHELPLTIISQLNTNEIADLTNDLIENIVRCEHLSTKDINNHIDYEIDEWVKQLQVSKEINDFIDPLKERIRKIYEVDIENKNNFTPEQNNSQSPNIFFQKVAAWCNELPILFDNLDRENVISNLVLRIFQKVWYLASNPTFFQNNSILKQTLDQDIKILLDELPQSKELETIKESITNKLVTQIIEHKDCFKRDAKQEFYKFLTNWSKIVMSYISDLSPEFIAQSQTELVFNILCKTLEFTDDPLVLDDDRFFQDLICEEIEKLIDKLSTTSVLQSNKHILALMMSYEIVRNKYIFIEERRQNQNDFANTQSPGDYESFETGAPASSSMTQQKKHKNDILNSPTSNLYSQQTPEQPIFSNPVNESNLSHFSQFQYTPYSSAAMPPTKNIEHQPSYLSNVSPPVHQSPNNFVQKVAAWCNELPILLDNSDREKAISNLVLQIFQKVWYLASNPSVFQNDSILKQTLDQHIKVLLDELPQSKKLETLKESITNTLVNQIIEHKDCFKKDVKREFYQFLTNWGKIVMSYISNLSPESIEQSQTELVFKILSKTFELTDDPVVLEDDRFFQDLICEEIEKLIDKLSKAPVLQSNKHILALMLSYEIVKNKYIFIEETRQNKNNSANTQRPDNYESFETGVPASSSMTQQTKRKNDIREIRQSQNEFPNTQSPGNYESFETGVPASSSMTQQTKHKNDILNSPTSNLHSQRTPEQPIVPNQPSYKSNVSPPVRQSPNIFVQKVAAWCNELPILLDNSDRVNVISNLVLQIFQKVWYLASNPTVFQNDSILKQTLDRHIKVLLDELPQSKELETIKDSITNTLVKKIIEHKGFFKKDIKREFYQFLTNWSKIVMSYISDLSPESISQSQTELVFNILSKTLEFTDDPLVLDDDRFFQDLICDEIEKLIDKLSKAPDLQTNKHILALMLSYEIVKNKYIFIEERRQNQNDFINTQSPGDYESFETGVPASSSITQHTKRKSDILNSPTSNLHSPQSPEQPIFSNPMNKSNLSHFSQSQYTPHSSAAVPPTKNIKHQPSYASNVSPPVPNKKSNIVQDKVPETSLASQTVNETKQILLEEIISWCHQLPLEGRYRESLETELLLKILYKANIMDKNINAKVFENKISKEIESILNDYPMPVKSDKKILASQLAKTIQNHRDCFQKTDYSSIRSIQDPTGSSKKILDGYDKFERETVTSSTPFKLNNNDIKKLSPANQSKTTDEEHYTSLISTKRPSNFYQTIHSLKPNKTNTKHQKSVSQSHESNLYQRQQLNQTPKIQIEESSQTKILHINTTGNYDNFPLNVNQNIDNCRRSNIQAKNRETDLQNIHIHDEIPPLVIRGQKYTEWDPKICKGTVPLSNVGQNVRESVAANKAYVSNKEYYDANRNIERVPDNDNETLLTGNINTRNLSIPVKEFVPNDAPQRPRKRQLEASVNHDNYNEDRLDLQSEDTNDCRCRERLRNRSLCQTHGFCIRPSCITCDSDLTTQCHRCCGCCSRQRVNSAKPKCLYD